MVPCANPNRPYPADVGLSRRRLLQVGGLGMLGLSLPAFLQAGAPTSMRDRSAKSCIFILLNGGPSHIDTWDLKPQAPAEIRGPYKPIATRVPGLQICELLPRLARWTDRCCLIRSMTHESKHHRVATHICMTGHSKPADDTPFLGSVLAKLRPPTHNVPAYTWLLQLPDQAGADVDGLPYRSGGFLGSACAPLLVGKNLDNPSADEFRVRAFDAAEGVTTDQLQERRQLLTNLESVGGPVAAPAQAGTFGRFRERAFDLITGPAARRAFDLEQEPATRRERYGRSPLGQNLLLARRLVEAGVRLVTVAGWTGLPPGESFRNTQTWDMHGMNPSGTVCGIFGTGAFGLGWALPRLDEAVPALLEDLETRGLLESTLVVVAGEFGRTPVIGKNAGRDHWPQCYSALLAGAGVRAGMVYGASDRTGHYVKDQPVCPEDFGATVLHALGVPPETRLGLDGATRPASQGQPITDLIG